MRLFILSAFITIFSLSSFPQETYKCGKYYFTIDTIGMTLKWGKSKNKQRLELLTYDTMNKMVVYKDFEKGVNTGLVYLYYYAEIHGPRGEYLRTKDNQRFYLY